MSALAGILWFAGFNSLLLVVLALAPAYQLELCAWVMNYFKSSHGREMRLIASGIVADPELRKDAHYSTAYFAAALGVPLIVLIVLAT